MSSEVEGLNPPQRQAVLHPGGALVVFAGAGSGKTRVITHRIAHLIASGSVPPHRILAVTFTNKAAVEMRERLERLVPGAAGGRGRGGLAVGTFHATCARLLRENADRAGVDPRFTIYDAEDQQAMIRRVLRQLGLDPKRYPPKAIAGYINASKRHLRGPGEGDAARGYMDEAFERVYAAYDERMSAARALDFGVLIYRMVRALEQDDDLRAELAGRYLHVLVDEFQDTNHAQFRLVDALSGVHGNLCVVGDDDQSIYGWRGADRRNILDFRGSHPGATVIKLEQNYRSTRRILRAAHGVIARVSEREAKELWTDKDDGAPVRDLLCLDERDEAEMLVQAVRELLRSGWALSDIAVLYRVHAQSRVIEQRLRVANVPYRIVGGLRFFDRAEVKDVLAYLRVVANPGDDVSLLRIVNVPTRGIGKVSLDRIIEAAARAGTGVFAQLAAAQTNPGLGKAVKRRIAGFVELIERLREHAAGGATISELGREVVDRTGYLRDLDEEDTAEADARAQNVRELIGAMEELDRADDPIGLEGFLEAVTLDVRAADDGARDRLTLMSVHAAKGLEFPVVVVVGLEDGLFPLRTGETSFDPAPSDEERRLAYVAFTRAKEQLVLSHAQARTLFGQTRGCWASPFLREIPDGDVQRLVSPAVRAASAGGAPFGWRHRVGGSRSGRDDVGAEWDEGAHRDRRGHEGDDAYLDTSEGCDAPHDDDLPGFRQGMAVHHKKFGVGRVLRVDGGAPAKVSVDFGSAGTRTIFADYLEPSA